MADTDIVKGYAVSAFSGLGAGALFSWIVGDFNAADYLIEFMSIGPLEIPFILACMVLVRKYGWRSGIFFTVSGLVASILLFRSTESVAPLVFLKIAVSGIILGSPQWFSGTFTARLSAVALPGVILAFLFGAPLIYHGAPEGTLDQLRQEALDMYSSFMSEDQAFNAVENATYLFEGVYKVGLGIFFSRVRDPFVADNDSGELAAEENQRAGGASAAHVCIFAAFSCCVGVSGGTRITGAGIRSAVSRCIERTVRHGWSLRHTGACNRYIPHGQAFHGAAATCVFLAAGICDIVVFRYNTYINRCNR